MYPVHKLQAEILKIIEQKDISGLSLRALGRMIGTEHPQIVKYHLGCLQKKGLLKYNEAGKFKKNLGGNIEKDVANIPLIKDLVYDEDLFSLSNISGVFKVAVGLLNAEVVNNIEKVVCIKAQNNIMNRADVFGKNIEEGDYVLVKLDTEKPNNGELILSATQGFAAVRRYVKDDLGQIVLLAESSIDYPPIYLDEKTEHIVFGRVLQVVKRPLIQFKTTAR